MVPSLAEKRPCEEKWVDWEKPENGWGTGWGNNAPEQSGSRPKTGFHPP